MVLVWELVTLSSSGSGHQLGGRTFWLLCTGMSRVQARHVWRLMEGNLEGAIVSQRWGVSGWTCGEIVTVFGVFFRLTPCFLIFFQHKKHQKHRIPQFWSWFLLVQKCVVVPWFQAMHWKKSSLSKARCTLVVKNHGSWKKNGKTGPMILEPWFFSGFCFGDMLAYQRKCS